MYWGRNVKLRTADAEWFGSMFILILGFQLYLSFKNVYITLGIIIPIQIIGWFVYYAAYVRKMNSMTTFFLLKSIALNILLVLSSAILPAVSAWVFDLTTFESIIDVFWIMEIIIYILFIYLAQSPYYYLLIVVNLVWFFLMSGKFVYDEAKTTIFYVAMWVFNYMFILLAEFAAENVWFMYILYMIIITIILTIYGAYAMTNQHDFAFYVY